MSSILPYAFSKVVKGTLTGLVVSCLAIYSTSASASSNTNNALEGVQFEPGMTPQQVQDLVNKKMPKMSERDEWGCTCLLCLANPNGWKSVNECVPPVKRLFRELRKGKPLPKCPQADESQNNLKFVYNPVMPCAKMGLNDAKGYVSEGRGSEVFSESWDGPGTSYCVGEFLYSYRRCIERDGGRCTKRVTVNAYDRVVANPQYDPIALDVTIQGEFWNRVHEY